MHQQFYGQPCPCVFLIRSRFFPIDFTFQRESQEISYVFATREIIRFVSVLSQPLAVSKSFLPLPSFPLIGWKESTRFRRALRPKGVSTLRKTISYERSGLKLLHRPHRYRVSRTAR